MKLCHSKFKEKNDSEHDGLKKKISRNLADQIITIVLTILSTDRIDSWRREKQERKKKKRQDI